MTNKAILCLISSLVIVPACMQASPPPQNEASSKAATVASERALVAKYCVVCHSDRLKTGGLSLQSINFENIPAGAETWEKVIHKVSLGAMPPQGMPRPDKATLDQLRRMAGNIDRSCCRGKSESGTRHAAPAEPHGIRQRRPRRARPGQWTRRRCFPPTMRATASTTSPTC